MKIKGTIFFFSILLVIATLTGCSDKNLDLNDDVSSIEMYEYGEDILIDTIEDEEFIKKLVKKLDKATTESTANIDFELPDYELVFKNAEDEELFNIGYFKDVTDLGVKGRYWKENEDLMYKVDLEVPVDL